MKNIRLSIIKYIITTSIGLIAGFLMVTAQWIGPVNPPFEPWEYTFLELPAISGSSDLVRKNVTALQSIAGPLDISYEDPGNYNHPLFIGADPGTNNLVSLIASAIGSGTSPYIPNFTGITNQAIGLFAEAANATNINYGMYGFGYGPSSVILDVSSEVTSAAPAGADSSLTWSHTISPGDNRMLLVAVVAEDTGESETNVDSVTYDGLSLTRAVRSQVQSLEYMGLELWYILDSDTSNGLSGAGQIVATFLPGGTEGRAGGAVTLYNVAQQAPEATSSSISSTASNLTIGSSLVTLTDGAWILDAFASSEYLGPYNADVGQTEYFELTGGDNTTIAMSAKEVTTAGVSSMGWTKFSGLTEGMAHVAVAVAPIHASGLVAETADANGIAGEFYGPVSISSTGSTLGNISVSGTATSTLGMTLNGGSTASLVYEKSPGSDSQQYIFSAMALDNSAIYGYAPFGADADGVRITAQELFGSTATYGLKGYNQDGRVGVSGVNDKGTGIRLSVTMEDPVTDTHNLIGVEGHAELGIGVFAMSTDVLGVGLQSCGLDYAALFDNKVQILGSIQFDASNRLCDADGCDYTPALEVTPTELKQIWNNCAIASYGIGGTGTCGSSF